MAGERLGSYGSGKWTAGEGVETELVNPATGETLASVSARGLDFRAALDHARTAGGAALRALSFAQRAKLIGDVADVLIKNRARYEPMAVANSGNTKIDAAIDIDGGIGTLKYYARLGAPLGEARLLAEDKPVRLGKAETYQAMHVLTPRQGVAIHITAFNFPSWGLWEKAAVSLLAGVPVVAKPASATALLTHAMVKDVIEANVLPAGALSLICGGAGDLLDRVTSTDLIAFTGSSETANRIRGHAHVLAQGVLVNVEADSVNAALLAPDAAPGTPIFDAFVKEVAREITVKAGQKCTAIRRVFVPVAQAAAVTEALTARLAKTTVGDPAREDVRMGPVVTRAQQTAALDGIRRLAGGAKVVAGGAEAPKLDGIDPAKSSFVAPTLLSAADASAAVIHDTEVFGPVATVVPYRDETQAAALVARGGGSLVASVFAPERDFLARMVGALGAFHGRLLMVEPSIADIHSGHGIVMPQCHHGGPGRAGTGEVLGGLHGLRLYHQRTAVQGSSDLLGQLQAQAATI
jgi:3,4-dehydroadipyl-CoA semialdehyde dehydrogenase